MESKQKLIKISWLVTIVLVILGTAMGYFLYFLFFQKTTETEIPSSHVKNTEIKTDLYDKIKNPPVYGADVSLEEPGYGRINPFVPYKNEEPEVIPEEAAAAAEATPAP